MALSSTSFKKGRIVPEFQRKNSSTRVKIKPPHLGKPHSEQTKRNISEARKGKGVGERNGVWKGGISKIEHAVRVMPEYIEWRSKVFQRDSWTCRTCNKNGGYMTAHHIKSFINILRENKISNITAARNCQELWDINNGVTLCEPCHSLTDNYKSRAKER